MTVTLPAILPWHFTTPQHPVVPPVSERTYTIPAESRTHLIPAESRTYTIPAEARTLVVKR